MEVLHCGRDLERLLERWSFSVQFCASSCWRNPEGPTRACMLCAYWPMHFRSQGHWNSGKAIGFQTRLSGADKRRFRRLQQKAMPSKHRDVRKGSPDKQYITHTSEKNRSRKSQHQPGLATKRYDSHSSPGAVLTMPTLFPDEVPLRRAQLASA